MYIFQNPQILSVILYYTEVVRMQEGGGCSGSPLAGTGSGTNNPGLNRVEKRDYTSNPSRRVVAESWNSSWFIYASMGALTKNQKKTLGIYFKAPADRIGVRTSYSYRVKPCPGACGHEQEYDVTNELPWIIKSNAKSASYTIDWKTGIFANNIIQNKGAGAFKVHYIRAEHFIENPSRINLNTEWK